MERDNDNDDSFAETEAYRSSLCANVLQDVGLQHPIMSTTFNICELAQRGKLKTLSVDELRRICVDLEEDISGI